MTPSDLWSTFGERLRRYISARVRNEHDTDDLLQTVFAKIHAGLGGVRSEDKLEPWLFQVARRAIADHFRSRTAIGAAVDRAEEPPAEDVGAEIASWLTPMMEGLDPADREALRLVDLEGLGQKELAARLGLSVTGAKSRVQRARNRLKEILLDCCAIELDRRGQALSYTPRNCSACSCE